MALLDEKGLSYLWGKIKALLNSKSNVGHKHSYNDLDNKPTIPTVPTKVSAFENDKGYLTQHQDLSSYAKKSDIPTVPTKLSQLSNDKTFLTKAEIEALIKTMVLDGYLGGKQIRYVDNASDTGKTGYLTVKKG